MNDVIKELRLLIADILVGLAYKILPKSKEKTGLLVWFKTNEYINRAN